MSQMIAWAAFLAAWLLVAGPLYQGALELREEDVDREGIGRCRAGARAQALEHQAARSPRQRHIASGRGFT